MATFYQTFHGFMNAVTVLKTLCCLVRLVGNTVMPKVGTGISLCVLKLAAKDMQFKVC